MPRQARQCPVRTHIAPANSLESRRTCTKAAGRRPSRPANDRQSSATLVGDEPLTTGVRGANDSDRLGVHWVKRTAGLPLWPGCAMPAPGAATWTQRCGTGRRAPGRPGGGICGGDSLKQCWRRDPKAAGSSNYPIGHDRRPKDPAPTAAWAGPGRGSGETGQRETVRTERSQRRAVTRRSAVEGRVSAVR